MSTQIQAKFEGANPAGYFEEVLCTTLAVNTAKNETPSLLVLSNPAWASLGNIVYHMDACAGCDPFVTITPRLCDIIAPTAHHHCDSPNKHSIHHVRSACNHHSEIVQVRLVVHRLTVIAQSYTGRSSAPWWTLSATLG